MLITLRSWFNQTTDAGWSETVRSGRSILRWMPRKSLGWKICPFLLRQRDMSSGTLTVITIIFSVSAVLSESFVMIAVLLWALLGHGSFTPRQGVSQATRQGRSWSTSNRSLSLVKLGWKSIVKVCFSFFLPSLALSLSLRTHLFLYFFLFPFDSLFPSDFLHLRRRYPTYRYCAGGGGGSLT